MNVDRISRWSKYLHFHRMPSTEAAGFLRSASACPGCAANTSVPTQRSGIRVHRTNKKGLHAAVSLLRILPRSIGPVAAMILYVSSLVSGQITGVSNVTSTPNPGTGHDYLESLNETVNPANGSLSLRLNVPIPEGRGFSLPFSFAYDSNNINYLAPPAPGSQGLPLWTSSGQGYFSMGGWSYTVPLLSEVYGLGRFSSPQTNPDPASCSYWDDFVFHDPNGGVHSLNVALAKPSAVKQGGPACSTFTQLTGGDDIFQAVLTGSSYFDSDPPAAMVAGADGTVYYYSSNSFLRGNKLVATLSGFTALPDYIVDRNGNQITVDSPPSTIFTYTDTLGRQLVAASGFAHDGDTVAVSGLAQPYSIHWGNTPNSKTSAYNVFLTPVEPNCGKGFPTLVPSYHNIVTSILLPNGQSYLFEYDPTYGLLNKVTYPTGASVSYTWGFNPQSDPGHFILLQAAPFGDDPIVLNCDFRYGSPVVVRRTVSLDGQHATLQQDFAYSTNWASSAEIAWSSKTTTLTTTDLVRSTSYSTVYTYAPMLPPSGVNDQNSPSSRMPVEDTIQVYAGAGTSGTPLRTTTKSWLGPNLLACELETLDDGQISGTFYDYMLASPRLLIDKKEYDYGLITDTSVCSAATKPSASPTRETVFNYQSFAHAPFPVLLAGTIPIFDGTVFAYQPSAIIVKDSGGNIVSEDDTAYDETPVSQTINVIGHDNTSYAASNNVRGNATTITSKCLPACVDSVSVRTYDDTGQLRSMKDQYSHSTQYSYDDNFTEGAVPAGSNTNAYVTTIAYPQTTTPAGTVNHTQSFTYAYPDGKITSATDQNGKQTIYSYNDALRRLKRKDYPDGGSVTIDYNEATLPWSMTTTEQMDSQRSLVSTNIIDGMGRGAQTRFESDPDGTDYVDFTYDGLGRKMTQSHPYRGLPPGILTQYAYDALNRVTDVANPDGSLIHTDYLGNCATTSDEAKVSRKVCTDGLGRLVQVVEDPAPASGDRSQTTSYRYDTLDKLVQVTQGNQQRFFMYDSIGRMIREKSSEARANSNLVLLDPITSNSQWSTAYAYDGNNNLISKTDARDITTNLGYDALNREISRGYSNDPSNTPPVTRLWDVPSASGTVENGIGRLVAVQSSGGTYTYDGYSAKGWVKQSTEIVDGQSFITQYIRDLAGHLTSEIYPSGRTVTMGIDGAGRIASVSGQTNNGGSLSNPVPYADSIDYRAHGGIVTVHLGNGLWEHTNYDPLRLQVGEIGVGTSQGSSDILKLTYDYGATNNNGNIQRQVLTARSTQGPPMVATQLARYDAFNRLTSAQEVNGDLAVWQPTAVWEQDLTYDLYGNRSSVTITPGLTTFSPAPAHDMATNRFVETNGFQYDAAGNLVQEPLDPAAVTKNSYTYDAEDRLIAVQQNGVVVAAYQYDGNGRRTKKILNSQTTTYVYDTSGGLIAEYSTASTGAAGRQFLSQDVLGSTRLITATDQSVVSCYDWMPFGELIPQGFGQRSSVPCYGPPSSVRQLYTGKERDDESGLDFFGARYMSSPQGRFNSVDPALMSAKLGNPQSLNRYSYALNNPLRYTDPDGKYPRDQHEFFTFWLATVAGRSDAAALAKGAGKADNFWNAATGLLGFGVIFNYSKHFGTPRNDVRAGEQGGFDAHLIEDHKGPNAPHARGLVFHVLSNLRGHSVDTDDSSFGGFQELGKALGIPAGDPVFANLEAVRKYVNSSHGTVFQITVNGETYGQNPQGDWKLVGTEQVGNMTVNTYKPPADPSVPFDDNILPGESQLEHDRQRACALGNPAACDH